MSNCRGDFKGHYVYCVEVDGKNDYNRYYGEKEDYNIVKLEFELKNVSEVGGDKNLRRYIRV